MAMVTTQGTSVGLAGSFALNDIKNAAKSLVDNSEVQLTGNLESKADGSQRIISICAAGGLNQFQQRGIAGQVSLNTIGSQTNRPS